MNKLKYMYEKDINQFEYISIPKVLFQKDLFVDITVDAKILYGLLLDKMSETESNQWFDETGRAFIIYPVKDMVNDLRLSKRKTLEILSELEKTGLIDRKRQGRGNPNMIYVKNFNANIG